MSNRKNMKRRQTERLLSGRRPASDIAAAKSLTTAALGILLGVAIVAYATSCKRKIAPPADSSPKGSPTVSKQAEPKDSTTNLESEPLPKNAIVDVNEQIANLKKRKLELARRLYDKLPNYSEPLILLGNVHRDMGDTSEAVRYWKKALEIGSARPDLYEGMGMVAMEKGQYVEAVDFWRKSLEYNPKDPALRTSVAQALMRLGRSEEAMKELKRQIEMYPASVAAQFLAGQIFLQRKEYERAREKYLKVIELDDEHTNAYYGLLTVSARLGEKDKVLQYREKFNKLKAGDTQELINENKQVTDLASHRKGYAETAFDAARLSEKYGLMEDAKALLDQAIEASADDPDIPTRIAQWHHRRGRIQQAISLHERIADKFPENGFNFLQLGLLYAQTQRFDEAKSVLKSSIEHSPESPDAYRELARLLLHTRSDISQARVLAEKAVSLAPTAGNYVVLSRACDTNGDRKAALEALQNAMRLDPANEQYRRIYDVISKRDP